MIPWAGSRQARPPRVWECACECSTSRVSDESCGAVNLMPPEEHRFIYIPPPCGDLFHLVQKRVHLPIPVRKGPASSTCRVVIPTGPMR